MRQSSIMLFSEIKNQYTSPYFHTENHRVPNETIKKKKTRKLIVGWPACVGAQFCCKPKTALKIYNLFKNEHIIKLIEKL